MLATIVVFAVSALAVLVAGCGDGTSTTATVTVTGQATVTVTTTTATTSPTGTTTPATTTIPWPPAGWKPGENAPVLQTPSGNIACYLAPSGPGFVACDAIEREWTLPPKPASCEFEWTDTISLDATGRAQFWCSSNQAFYGPNEYWPWMDFPYGASVSRGGIRWTSRVNGVTCTNREKHGFALNRQRAMFY
jgi:hypothetical protein